MKIALGRAPPRYDEHVMRTHICHFHNYFQSFLIFSSRCSLFVFVFTAVDSSKGTSSLAWAGCKHLALPCSLGSSCFFLTLIIHAGGLGDSFWGADSGLLGCIACAEGEFRTCLPYQRSLRYFVFMSQSSSLRPSLQRRLLLPMNAPTTASFLFLLPL